jgi:hypothetical protein
VILFILELAAAAQGYVGETMPDVRLSKEDRRAISRECDVPRRWLRLRADGIVRFRPPARARYEQVDCVIRELRRRSVGSQT